MVTGNILKQFQNTPPGDRGKKIHPHKFVMWVAIGSILMMFAGLTSAYIVKSNQASWQEVIMPKIFWVSTAVILISSLTVQMALRSFKQREMNQYRRLIAVTFVLGIAFVVLQCIGFVQLWDQSITLKGSGAGQFLYVIFGLHAVHVLGGVIALMVMFMKAFFGKTKLYSSVPVEVAATYWHFVDALWIYLLVFFLWIG
jgi:cytochrome c oxidase subunit 3